MRFLFLLFILIAPAWAAPSLFFDGSLQAEVPGIFRPLDQAAIDQMFAGARSKPGVVLATPDSETRISITHAEAPLGPEALEETRVTLKARVDSQATVTWVRDEMATLNGTSWFRLDYDLETDADRKREIILGTSLQGRLLFLVIATPLEDQELITGDLEALIASLKLVEAEKP